ncbi:MAG: tetratricopeptide repeat protein [Epsilonproteobacteria bacterium]|nr:tetratricopeptide repeat protein [Campylobacterota bacterium]OIO13869.1 MAG: hypothetical protein AUJ81_10605 [Helicobacteraceae bacterium CG1_02_36_14]PIP11507.1 MAG: hypothetical protein COX50_00280 [Sulfurimonas sp. CG23_combo_of_CG06-09_8_20_14_all_36_33]PIS24990.1 MAG: hypothetical protein COT46_07570 [Sulfurimonas sp. CG08_land_8_20_14_0_20_36_33]PIU34868.1 MAG: hypothetical protein COT05_05875 [Sulfurimonas sp. CG07_land_8_20_14_0_80_36_56]PIV04530.1 MAG: hypothetical protein COS56_0
MDSYYQQAMDYYSNKNLFKAKEIFKQIIVEYPTHHQSMNMLGLIANSEGDTILSTQYINKAVELDQNNGFYRNNLGVVYLMRNEYDAALNEFLKAIELTPSNSDAYSNAGYIYYREGNFDTSKKMLEKALEYNPQNVQAYLYGANVCREMNDYTQALGHYTTVVHLDPTNVESYLKRAEIYYGMGVHNEALENYLQAIEIDSTLLHNNFITGTINQIYTKLFPSYRYEFYNNKKTLDIYEQWIAKHIHQNSRVLEYSDAEGLLSIKSAKEGTQEVVVCIVEPFLAIKATQLAKINGVESRVKVINKEPSDLTFGQDIEKKMDFLLIDIFRHTFPTYKNLLMIKNLKEKFLESQSTVFPSSISMMAAPIHSQELWNYGSATDTMGVDIQILHSFKPYYMFERLRGIEYELLSQPVQIYNFKLGAMPSQSWNKTFETILKSNKNLHGMVIWFVYHLDENLKIDYSPLIDDKRYYFIHLFDKPIVSQNESSIKFTIHYSDFPIISDITTAR